MGTEERDTRMVSIVDDDPSVRRSVGNLLTAIGFAVATFASAEAFLVSTHRQNTACLVLDLRMPGGLGGLELLSRLSSEGARIPVVVLTAIFEAATRERCLEAGAVAYLIKPFDPQVLSAAVTTAIHRDRSA